MINDKSSTPPAVPDRGASQNSTKTTTTAPLFRRVDWLTFLITFGAVMLGYYLTLAPEMTLEDSGELATGSFYAGIPHPPGYPVWTVYTWLWTVLLPVGNVAWRVALATAFSSAFAAGLLGLLVSRGSSLLMEGIEELKEVRGTWESAICTISGFTAGTLMGFNGFLWSQSVIVEVYAFSVMSFMITLLCLLRWIYAPHQYRFLYYAFFAFGISFTNHQSLIVAAMGIEVAIAAADFKLGRNLFLWNSIVYLAGLILKAQHKLGTLEANPAVFVIFNVVGVCSIAAYIWFSFLTKEAAREIGRDGLLALAVVSAAAAPAIGFLATAAAILSLIGFAKLAWDAWPKEKEWLVTILSGVCWIGGAAFYFYMPLAGMTNPPMQWGYPRTAEGFWHAFTRGQYEKTNPTDILGDPMKFLNQLGMLGSGIIEEFNWVYVVLAIIPFLFFLKLHRRERAWILGITAIYLCLGVLMLILLNPPPDRASRDLVRVFFGASHALIALLIGYGMTLVAAYLATHYKNFRSMGLIGAGFAIALALYSYVRLTTDVYFGESAQVGLSTIFSLTVDAFTNKDQFGLPIYASLILIAMSVGFLVALLIYRERGPLLITLGIFALMPLYPVMTHWSNNEQRNHWFGYWFGHDMFTPPFTGSDGKPLYPEMAKDAVLYGGTDPGRFAPTYMIFCDSFVPSKDLPKWDQKFDRRDVYIITQNALADGTYLNYIRAHYNRSTQIDPPFFQEFLQSEEERMEGFSTNLLARSVAPLDRMFTALGDRIEKRRRTYTSWFEPSHFMDLPAFATKLKTGPAQDALSKYIYDSLSEKTKRLLASGDMKALGEPLAEDLNSLMDRDLKIRQTIKEKTARKLDLEQQVALDNNPEPAKAEIAAINKEMADLSAKQDLYTPQRFSGVKISEYLQDFIKQNPQSHSRVRLNRLLLEAAYPGIIQASKGGVYPDREIYIATPGDSKQCFDEYLRDAQRRLQLNQLEPNEDVRVVNDKVQVSGQVAVMAINALLTKVMFDANPKNEFYVEESFPLKWMYPHLTPYGVIMKINREQQAELSEDVVSRDHEFWTQYSKRLIGDWITYDTKVSEIAEFVERVYLRRNFKGFTGDRKFVRDDQAQKAFSKLRSSIAGLYNWRIANAKPGAEQQRMVKEADFALRQAFAYCPYSPEAVYRYVQLLLSMQRFDDALIVVNTCLKLDPNNAQVLHLKGQLVQWQQQSQGAATGARPAPPSNLAELERLYKEQPTNFQNGFNLAMAYLQMQQMSKGLEVLDAMASDPRADSAAHRALFQAFSSLGQTGRMNALIETVEAKVRSNSNDLHEVMALAEGYKSVQKKDMAIKTLDSIMARAQIPPNLILEVAQEYAGFMDYGKLEGALDRLVQLSPDSPEAWYNQAALKAALGKQKEAVDSLNKCLQLSAARRAQDPNAHDLKAEALKDPRFGSLKDDPTFKKLVGQ